MKPNGTIPDLRTTRLLPWFLMVVGATITGLWLMLLMTGQVPEIETGDRDIWFHLVAELVTAQLLITAGVLSLRRTITGDRLAGIALGALLYTTINSAGFYADQGEWAAVGMFGVLTAATLIATFDWINRWFRPSEEPSKRRIARARRR